MRIIVHLLIADFGLDVEVIGSFGEESGCYSIVT